MGKNMELNDITEIKHIVQYIQNNKCIYLLFEEDDSEIDIRWDFDSVYDDIDLVYKALEEMKSNATHFYSFSWIIEIPEINKSYSSIVMNYNEFMDVYKLLKEEERLK